MRIISINAILLAMLFSPLLTNAQKIDIDGDIAFLKTETSIGVKYTYDNLTVGKSSSEKEYVDEKKKQLNDKSEGRGDLWANKWFSDREAIYEPKFEDLFMKESKMTISKNAKYTLIIKTTAIEPGYNIGGGMFPGSRHNAELNATVLIIETAHPDKVLATVTLTHVPGGTFGGSDYDADTRIAECYAKAGKSLGKKIR
jgi:hypothetical protein